MHVACWTWAKICRNGWRSLTTDHQQLLLESILNRNSWYTGFLTHGPLMSSCPACFWATRCARDAMLQLEHRWNWECWVKSCWSNLNYPVIVINCGQLPSRRDCEWSRYGIATCSQQDLKAMAHLCLTEAIAKVDWAWLMACWVDPVPTLPSNI